MEQTNQVRIDPPAKRTASFDSRQADAWVTRRLQETTHPSAIKPIEYIKPVENQQSKGRTHACKASRRGYQQARDRLKRADRDLGETAAFIAASLTTATAIQAVISVATDKLGLSREILQQAFNGYVAIFILILLMGAIRVRSALRRRAQAEREIDQTKKGIFEFCPTDQWPKLEE